MTDWNRPHDFEFLVDDKFEALTDEGAFDPDEYDAFLSGALFAALIAEGRVS